MKTLLLCSVAGLALGACSALDEWAEGPNTVVVDTDAYASEQAVFVEAQERCAVVGPSLYPRLKSQATTIGADSTYDRRFLFECTPGTGVAPSEE